MLRFLAGLCFLLATVSLLTTVNAYQISRPTNPTSVSVVSANAGLIQIDQGSGDTYGWVVGAGSGSVTINMTKGRTVGTTYYFDNNTTYTMYKVVKLTNSSGATLSISMNGSTARGSFGTITGYVNGGASAVAGPWSLANGGFVEVNIPITTSTTGTDNAVTFTVSAN